MRMYDIIQKKKIGEELTKEEIEFFIKGYTAGEIPDYQASALTMAICFQGMTDKETTDLTVAMAESGDQVDLSRFGKFSVDKHSTGGVGDKTSLIVTPIVASLGGKITKMSGRGLGHTGGTVDKLEAIPGYQTTLSQEDFLGQVEEHGIAIIGQSGNLAPADKKLYALRDVTATVDSIPLITSSIMSKKIAAGSKNIVLDVKVGSGAFMKTLEDAEELASKMVDIGKMSGRNVAALLTNMDTPLGKNIGNTLEVIEAVDVLKNGTDCDLKDVCVALASLMVVLIHDISYEEAEAKVNEVIDNGSAFAKMKEWIDAQGGNSKYLDDVSLFEQAAFSMDVVSESDGYIGHMDAEEIGIASVCLGAGRVSKEDSIDFSAGIILASKTGDYVKKGDKLLTLYTNNEASLEEAREKCLEAISVQTEKPELLPCIYKMVK